MLSRFTRHLVATSLLFIGVPAILVSVPVALAYTLDLGPWGYVSAFTIWTLICISAFLTVADE